MWGVHGVHLVIGKITHIPANNDVTYNCHKLFICIISSITPQQTGIK